MAWYNRTYFLSSCNGSFHFYNYDCRINYVSYVFR